MSRRLSIAAVGLIWSGFVTLTVAAAAGLHVNRSVSMPIGVWRSHAVTGQIRRGDVVAVCLAPDELIKRYVARGSCANGIEPVLKTVGAVAGDTVVLDADGAMVNGLPVPNTAALPADEAGRLLPAFPAGTYVVQPGQIFLFSSHSAESFDSRYYGPIETSSVIATATPVLTFN